MVNFSLLLLLLVPKEEAIFLSADEHSFYANSSPNMVGLTVSASFVAEEATIACSERIGDLIIGIFSAYLNRRPAVEEKTGAFLYHWKGISLSPFPEEIIEKFFVEEFIEIRLSEGISSESISLV